jgi:predicted GH43/DUF377 family glycosyl hydrolase
MKLFFSILFSSFLIIFFNSCIQENTVNPDNQTKGNMVLTIDKVNAPSDVVFVEAELTRQGYDTISDFMNILTDSTADLTLNDVHAGMWHLMVSAKDSLETVLYAGETDVTIYAGFTTQVSLTLSPTGEGTGDIYIWVTWGTPTQWADFSGNPILSLSGQYYDAYGIGLPNVIFADGIYKMWYVGDAGASKKYVLYAESNDGINWTRPLNHPVLYPGSPGSWDDYAVHPGALMYEDGMYYMFYSGFSDPYGRWDIGYAYSSDGINWTKYPTPILYGTNGIEYQIGSSSVIKVENTYYLYYTMRDIPYLQIGLATSTDRINWQRSASNPVLLASQSWEGNGVYHASVLNLNGQFVMYYMNAAGTGFGKANSSDGVNWVKGANNPFFTKEDTHNYWASYKIAYPFIFNNNNSQRIYYTGFISSTSYKIGVITR